MDHKTSGAVPDSELPNADDYDPGRLLDLLLRRLHLAKDSQLASRLNLDRRVIAGIRAGKVAVSGTMLMIMREATGITLDELRRTLRDRRRTSRMPRRPPVAYKA